MFAAILTAASGIGTIPVDSTTRESVDLIETNHYFDEQARLVFVQVIFYDWSAAGARYNVRAWRLVKSESQLPQRDWKHGGYVVAWHDGEHLRQVRSKNIRETWTQAGVDGDPELNEREVLAKELRRELRAPMAPPRSGASVVVVRQEIEP